MPVKLRAIIPAEGVSIDSFTGRATLFNIVDGIYTLGIPALMQRLYVMAMYELGNEPQQLQERVEFTGPAGDRVVESTSLLDLQARVPAQMPWGHSSVHVLTNLVLPTAGEYRLTVFTRTPGTEVWDQMGAVPIVVTRQPHPMHAAGNAEEIGRS